MNLTEFVRSKATPFEIQRGFFMNLIEVMKRFPDQEACITYLERLRWRNKASCPHCGSVDVIRKKTVWGAQNTGTAMIAVHPSK